jgi:hypothetical protein
MLRNLLLAAAFLAAAGLAGGIGPSATAQPTAGAVEACPERLPEDADLLICLCTPENTGGGTIWGADVYTADSPICRAAAHAGVTGDRGGVVEVRSRPGRSSYPAVTRNGIISNSWAAFPRSITFRGASETPRTASCPERMPEDATALVCICNTENTGDGPIWGSNTYTADSALCRAATHAGVIGPDGGVVDVRSSAGRSSYPAATRHGIESGAWGSFPRSISFREPND